MLRGSLIRILDILVHVLHRISCILCICSFRCCVIDDYGSPELEASQTTPSSR